MVFFFSSRRRHTRFDCDWSSDVCSSDLPKSTPPIEFPIMTAPTSSTDGEPCMENKSGRCPAAKRRAEIGRASVGKEGRSWCREGRYNKATQAGNDLDSHCSGSEREHRNA